MTKADLAGARLLYADLTEANLDDAILTDADLTGACLHHAKMNRAELSDAIMPDGKKLGLFTGIGKYTR